GPDGGHGVSPGPRRERFVSGAPSGPGGRGTWRGPGPCGDVTDGGGGALSGSGAAPDRRAAPDGGARGRGCRPVLGRERVVSGAPSGPGGRGTWRGPGPRGDVTDGGGGALSGSGAAPDRRAGRTAGPGCRPGP